MHINQSTDIGKLPSAYFFLRFSENSTQIEQDQTKLLIIKNDTRPTIGGEL